MIDSLNIIEGDCERAIQEHNAALAKLRRPDGQPLYADDIMHAEAVKARQTLTAKLDRLNERTEAIAADSLRTAAAGRDDIYSWLTDDELQRAALLLPFIRQDVEVMGPDGLRNLEFKVRTGRKLDKIQSWLFMREAARLELPGTSFEWAAMPEHLTAAEAQANAARKVKDRIKQVRPETKEHLMRDVMGRAGWTATGQTID